jgi:O-antigen/teichoic acid export membrane protein
VSPTACWLSTLASDVGELGGQLKRLGKHSAIYGLGGLVSRILAVLLLPLYTRYLSPSDYGQVETLIALTTVIGIVLRMGIHSAFFRFYFDSSDPDARRLVLRTSFWFTMAMATIGLVMGLAFSGVISSLLFDSTDESELVMAAFVGLWAGMNYEQVTSLFRVEERSVAFVSASLANIFLTIGATVLLVVELDKGPIGVIVGNFTGTLLVYAVLVAYRREQLGLQFDRGLLREMNRFGIPLVPTALFLWVTNFSDRLFLVKLADTQEVGLYSVGVRIASALVLLLTAFRLAWPAFAYSIEDDGEARRTYGYVLTYLVFLTTWVATGLALLSPWIVDWIAAPAFAESSRVVGPLAFSTVAFAAYIVVAIGVGRSKRTQFNWIVTGAAAAVNVALNLLLIPPYGMMGAAVATIAAYTTMFVGMVWWSQRIYPVPYQWRRVVTAAATGMALVVLGKLAGGGLPVAVALALVYPLALLPLGFYLPAERRAIGGRLRLAR